MQKFKNPHEPLEILGFRYMEKFKIEGPPVHSTYEFVTSGFSLVLITKNTQSNTYIGKIIHLHRHPLRLFPGVNSLTENARLGAYHFTTCTRIGRHQITKKSTRWKSQCRCCYSCHSYIFFDKNIKSKKILNQSDR